MSTKNSKVKSKKKKSLAFGDEPDSQVQGIDDNEYNINDEMENMNLRDGGQADDSGLCGICG